MLSLYRYSFDKGIMEFFLLTHKYDSKKNDKYRLHTLNLVLPSTAQILFSLA